MVHGVGVAVAAGFGLHQSSTGSGGSSGKESACNAGAQELHVQSLDQEDPLKEEMATHSLVFLPGDSHGQRTLVGYSP